MPRSLQEHLRTQIGYLRRSCEAFDANQIDEAIRIATVIRVLIHDTKNSTSLLKHLGATTINLLSTAESPSPQAIFYMGLGCQVATTTTNTISGGYAPIFDGPIQRLVPVSKWWDQIVYVLNSTTRLKRSDIVLVAADKDGGAHVDSKLEPKYETLAKKGAAGALVYQRNGIVTHTSFTNAHLVALRQMAYELLHSPDLISISQVTE